MGKERGGLSTGIRLSLYSAQISHLLADAHICLELLKATVCLTNLSFASPVMLTIQTNHCNVGLNSDLIYIEACERKKVMQNSFHDHVI